jgi:hypothetical protein
MLREKEYVVRVVTNTVDADKTEYDHVAYHRYHAKTKRGALRQANKVDNVVYTEIIKVNI